MHEGNMQDIIMVGLVAQGSAQILAAENEQALLQRYSKRYVKRMQTVPELKPFVSDEACMVQLENQGVFQGLWELGELAGTGMKVALKDLPVHQEVIEVANFLDINPYELPCSNGYIFLAENGTEKVRQLCEVGYQVTYIGRLTKEKARLVINGEDKRFLTPVRAARTLEDE